MGLRDDAASIAQQFGIPADLFASLIGHESSWNQGAVSPMGAIGLTQLMPGTAKEMGVDPANAEANLQGGAKYLKQMYDRFGDWGTALAAYNAGPGNTKAGRGYADTVLAGAKSAPYGESLNDTAVRMRSSEQPTSRGFLDYLFNPTPMQVEQDFQSPQEGIQEAAGRVVAGINDFSRGSEAAERAIKRLVRNRYAPGRSAYTKAQDENTFTAMANPFTNFALGLNDPIGVWHGSPHLWDRPEIRPGAGSGAMAQGHGFYAADREGTGRSYVGPPEHSNYTIVETEDNPGIFHIRDDRTNQNVFGPFRTMEEAEAAIPESKGALYRLTSDIDPSHLLDWDKPLSQQTPYVQAKLQALAEKNPIVAEVMADAMYRGQDLREVLTTHDSVLNRGPFMSDEEYSKMLNEAGIPGTKYADAGSRNSGDLQIVPQGGYFQAVNHKTGFASRFFKTQAEAEAFVKDQQAQQTYNYVIFDPSRMTVLERK